MSSVAAPAQATRSVQQALNPRYGLIAGVVMMFIAAIGIATVFNGRLLINPILSLGYLILFAAPFTGAYLAGRRTEGSAGVRTLAGAVSGLIAAVFPALLALLVQGFPGIRETFPNMSPDMVSLLTFGQESGGIFLLLGVTLVIGLLAGLLATLPMRVQKALAVGAETVIILAIFEAVVEDMFEWFRPLTEFLYEPAGGLSILSAVLAFVVAAGLAISPRATLPSIRTKLTSEDTATRTRTSLILAVVVAILLFGLPQLMGGILNELFTNVGLFLLMALGLNIVVGLAGLLDLGYVAFFAVGAYTMALLTSPISPYWAPMLSWWVAFPAVIIASAIAGIMVGTPVIRMRGDYLAIVTLGFGEIVRLVLLSDWMAPYFGGAQGLRNIPGIPVGDLEINATSPDLMVYAVIAFVLLAAYITWRVQESRIGRAWAAIREDEDVAEAIGVDTVKAKLLAFVTGATLAGFAGALFAAKVGSVFTSSFEIIVSIVILVIVIVGGMGNIVGVAAGALLLIGVLGGPQQPGLLQEFGEYKLLIYGALLVLVMLKKPEGLIPSTRRARELHQDEFLQDAWLEKGGEFTEQEKAEMGAKV